jgi:hypothetical protein
MLKSLANKEERKEKGQKEEGFRSIKSSQNQESHGQMAKEVYYS